MATNTALVLGAQGIIGRTLVDYLTSRDNWHVKAVSRRRPTNKKADYRPIDLLSPDALTGVKDWLKDVTHVFFAAYQEHRDPADQSKYNLLMLKHTVEAVEQEAEGFRHVSLPEGAKAYGAHLGVYKTPAKESDPHHFGPNFYYDQEDYVREASRGKRWGWTVYRPDMVLGFAVGNPMNIGNVLAVYASLCKELRIPLRFPGTPQAYNILVNITNADLLARAMEWAALNESCYGEIFNITNGDVFRWNQVFPKIAAAFGIECAEPQTFRLVEAMRDMKDRWDEVVKKHNLEPYRLDELAGWPFGDFIFGVEVDAISDVNKARRFGFQGMTLDSGDEFVRYVRDLQERRVIPS